MNKMKKIKDIEYFLNCPIEVVFEALDNGIYYEDESGAGYVANISLVPTRDSYDFFWDKINSSLIHYVHVYDYKKTWWLREDKSK